MKNYLNYYKAKLNNCSHFIELESLGELYKYIEKQKIDTVFIDSKSPTEQCFVIAHQNLLICNNTKGFNTIEEYITATEKGFSNANDYYMAQQQGYSKYEDYLLVQQAGIADLITFETIKKKGFIAGYNKFKEIIASNAALNIDDKTIENPYQLYLFAKKENFEDCNILLEALERGFTNANVFNTANTAQFPTYADFVEATNKQFATYEDLIKARELGIRDAEDFTKYLMLLHTEKDNASADELILINILSKLEEGKKISSHKLSTTLENAVKEYEYSDTQQLPIWFKRTLTSEESINNFLEKSNAIKSYGSYDSEGEYFEIHKLQNRAVVLDASNIAHNSNNNADKKVMAARIITVVEFLKSKGFADITIVADASLRHKVEDKDVFDKLKKDYNYVQSPVNTSADSYIISIIKIKHCLVVSNDGFRQWKLQDKWSADNLDFYRLGFIINNDEVVMPDVK